MKKLLFLITAIVVFASCTKENALPQVENITKGSKWTLEIGSSPEEVYNQIQMLNKEKKLGFVTIPQSKLSDLKFEDITKLLSHYNRIILMDTSKYTRVVVVQFKENRVSIIGLDNDTSGTGGTVSEWPQNLINEKPIQINDQTKAVCEKLLAIHKIPDYSNYRLIQPKNKPLNKPYDPYMAGYNIWSFSFQTAKGGGKVRVNSVKLYFENNKLVEIQNEYDESKPVYDAAENQ